MAKLKQMVGQIISSEERMVEESLVRRYCKSFGLNPEKEANKKGHLRLPDPGVAAFGDFEGVVEQMGLKPRRILHNEETIAVIDPVYSNEKLLVTTTIKEVFQKIVGGNPMGFIQIEVCGEKKSGQMAFLLHRLLLIRGGLPNR
jgi:hypothetical protein